MPLIFNTSLYLNGVPGSGGGSIDESKIIVKSATIPTADADHLGAVYQYVGETDANYTHGYIYECVSSESTLARATYDPAYFVFDEDRGSLLNFFAEASDDYLQVVSGRFKYLADGDIWNINGLDENGDTVFEDYQLYTQDLIDAGFTFIVPMTDIADGAEVAYELTYFEQTNYAWERLDVQPSTTYQQEQADWNQTNTTAVDYIKNKPTIPAAQVNSDWNASSGVAEILNKPSLATVATSGLYSDLSGTPTIPTVNDATLTITQGGVSKGTFTANASSNTTIALDAGVEIDNKTITKNSLDQLQAEAIINQRTGTDALPVWQGTQAQWETGGEIVWYAWENNNVKVYTLTDTPTTSTQVYSEPDTQSALTITSVGEGTITLSDTLVYSRNSVGDETETVSVGEAHPDWICYVTDDQDTKANVNADNFTATGKSTLAGFAMPSDSYEALTPVAHEALLVTAPANGYVQVLGTSAGSGWCAVGLVSCESSSASINDKVKMRVVNWCGAGATNWMDAYLPVKAGDKVYQVAIAFATESARFIYAEGEV